MPKAVYIARIPSIQNPRHNFHIWPMAGIFVKVSLFLGAGASVMFGKPTTKEFLEVLQTKLDSDKMEFYRSLNVNIKFNDVEDVLQTLKDVRLFAMKEIGKLVFRTLPAPKPPNNGDFLSLCTELELQIKSSIKSHYGWNHDHDQRLQDVYDDVFSALSQTGSITVFTTNYDTVIETYCRAGNYACVDGFVQNFDHREWTGKFDTEGVDKPVRLYKLHGSLDWKRHREYGIIQGLELGNTANTEEDIMIMPTHSPKDEESKTPFGDIFDLMKQEFKEQDACIVIGYSFRDENINEVFREFVQDKKTLIVVSPTLRDDMKNLFVRGCKYEVRDDRVHVFTRSEGFVLGFESTFDYNSTSTLISNSLSAIRYRVGDDT